MHVNRPWGKRQDLRSSTGIGTGEECQEYTGSYYLLNGARWELLFTSGGTLAAIIYLWGQSSSVFFNFSDYV